MKTNQTSIDPALNNTDLESLPKADQLVARLSKSDYAELEAFARKRLASAAASPPLQRYLVQTSPLELVDQVIVKVLLGDCGGKVGRTLKPRNRRSEKAFMECLKGMLCSELSNLVTSAEARYEHLPVGEHADDPLVVDPPDRIDQEEALARRDLQQVVFARLYARAAQNPELLPIIQRWEEAFLADDRIPQADCSRKLVWRVRSLARGILRQLAQEHSLGEDERQML